MIIIALGESVIATGITASGICTTGCVGLLLAIAFVAVAGLWWCYFDWVHTAAEARLARKSDHQRRFNLARDLFALGHLPIVGATAVFAAAIKEALLHPGEQLQAFGISARAVGPSLYLAGFVAGNLRATGRRLIIRTGGLVGVHAAALLVGNAFSATAALGTVAAVIVAIAAAKTLMRFRRASASTSLTA